MKYLQNNVVLCSLDGGCSLGFVNHTKGQHAKATAMLPGVNYIYILQIQMKHAFFCRSNSQKETLQSQKQDKYQ